MSRTGRSGGDADDGDSDADADTAVDTAGGSRTRGRPERALSESRSWLERRALRLTAVVTAALLVVMLYFPVGIVFSEALVVEGRPSPARFLEVLADPFYFGVLAEVIADPLAIDRHLSALLGWVAGISVGVGTGVPWLRVDLPPIRKGLFGFTAYQAALSTVASVALGLPAAYVLANFEFRGRRTLRSLTILPFVLPGIMVAVGFYAAFGREGTVNAALSLVGLGPIPLVERYTLAIIVVAHAFYNAPLVARITVAAWESVDVRTLETARSLGAGKRRAFLDVVVPQIVPAVLTGALLTFIFTFMTFPVVLALGGVGYATVEVWIYARVRQLAIAEAATLAVLETAVSLALTYAYLRYEAGRSGMARTASAPRREPLFPSLRSALAPRRLAVLAYALVAVVVFLGPIASMVHGSFTDGSGLTLRHYAFLAERQTAGAAFQTRPLPAIRNSLLFGVATLAVALPMGVVIAVLTTRPGRGRTLVDAIAMLPLAVSGIVFGIGLLQGLVFGISLPGGWRLQVTGAVAIVAAHAVAAYPFVTRNVSPLLSSLDPAMVESARALGATRTRALLDVELPLVASGVVAGAAFAFAISIGEFSSTVLLASGSDAYTMPVAVERYLGRRNGPAIAMGTVLLVVTSASFVVVDRVGGRFERD